MSSGPSGPTGVKVEAPQPLIGCLAVPAAGVAARRNDLDAGVCRAGWYSRRVRASAERGRVQGPGRAEAHQGPRTVAVVRNSHCYSRLA
jgi:hypothetical protein